MDSDRILWSIDDSERYAKCPKCYFQYDIWNNRSQGLPAIFNFCPSCGNPMIESEVKED